MERRFCREKPAAESPRCDIKTVAEGKGFTKKEMAMAVNMDVSMYSSYERGLHEPSYLARGKIISVLKVDANYFLMKD